MEVNNSFFGKEKISRILIKLAPPVMLAQLIQALYNIVDSLFVGKYSSSGLTALSIIYPIQLLMIAFAVGTGVGINTLMSRYFGIKDYKRANAVAGVGLVLGIGLWLIFAVVSYFFLPAFAGMSTKDENVIHDIIIYGRIACVFSFGLFLESIWSKILQAEGKMLIPMVAQMCGALVNIILDPILIFGMLGLPEMGMAGAAISTVAGQIVAAIIVMVRAIRKSPKIKDYKGYLKNIYVLGLPNILMQSAYTVYIFGLNMILKGFSDQAVTALGLYYKWQTFFFIPLGALQTCIVPVISYNYAGGNFKRCSDTLNTSLIFGAVLMLIGVLCFEIMPSPMLSVFTADRLVIDIGVVGFRIIGISFIPMVTSLIYPVFFQAIGYSVKSSLLTVLRTVVLFVPVGYAFSRIGLNYFWLTFPITELLTSVVGFALYRKFYRNKALPSTLGEV